MANDWYKVTMPAKEAGIGGKMMELENAFGEFLVRRGTEYPDAAMLGDHSEDFEEHHFYFSPQAIVIAKPLIERYGGVPSPPPAYSERLHCCAGSSGIIDKLIPKKPSTK